MTQAKERKCLKILRKLDEMTTAIERLEQDFAIALNELQIPRGAADRPSSKSAGQLSFSACPITGRGAGGFAEVKAIRDKAESARKRAQREQLGVLIENRAAELKLRAERRLGQLLDRLAPRGGDRRSSSRNYAGPVLVQLGVTHNQSSRWRREASLPDREF